MQTVVNAIPDHVLVFTAPEKMARADIRSFVQQMEEKLSRHDRIGVVADVTRLESMTPGAFIEDLRAEVQYLGQWDRFPNLALVATDGFLKSMAETISGVLPNIDLRVFAPSRMDEAIEFAARAGVEAGDGVTANRTR